jgi:hypothetical protein
MDGWMDGWMPLVEEVLTLDSSLFYYLGKQQHQSNTRRHTLAAAASATLRALSCVPILAACSLRRAMSRRSASSSPLQRTAHVREHNYVRYYRTLPWATWPPTH